MATILANMTPQEFEEFFSELLERKLLELLIDPDKGHPITHNSKIMNKIHKFNISH